MLILANHKEGVIWVSKTPVKVARGQLGWSQDRLSSEFGWTRQQVRTFLKHLKRDQMINQEKHGKMSIITILNYDKFHGDNQENNHPVTNRQPTDNQPVTTNKNDKKVNIEKKLKNLNIYSAERIEIIEDFNTLFNAEYMPNSEALVKLMNARLKEGHTVEQFQKVHRNMKQAWENDNKMSKFLRPQTLYTGKFSSYLNWRTTESKLSSAGRQTAENMKKIFGEDEDA
jgi:uncharacterized phage protein (TIGR02220 family)